MAKILLVEDDKSLREIYGVRLMAEGYEIVSAGDGEEALAMAIKERPDLIVSDVMMPKISGFDMLDILRSTTETKDVKVIMMTALSSDDQRARGESLGADRYLVKSQVGIEDVVRTVHDVLGDSIAAAPAAVPAPATPAPAPAPAPVAEPVAYAAPVAPAPEPVITMPEPTPAPVQEFIPEPVPAAPVAPAVDSAYAAPIDVPAPVAPAPAPEAYAAPAPAPVAEPVAYAAPVAPAPEPVAYAAPAPAPEAFTTPAPAGPVLNELPANPEPLPQPTAPFSSPAPASLGERVIEPLTNLSSVAAPVDIASQMAQELNNQQNPGTPPVPPVQ